MNLLEGEKRSITITEDDTADLRMLSGRCLVGRIMSERRIQKEAFRTLMARLWKRAVNVLFKELHENIWLIEFSTEADKRRVMEGRPWLFDKSVLVLKEVVESIPLVQMDFSTPPFWIQVHDMPLICLNWEVGYKIGETIGEVEDVDVTGEGIGWGRCLRIRVLINLSKPLERGRALNLNGKSVWISFRYEKLPHFCFRCGRIFHDQLLCSERKEPSQNVEASLKHWGSWLHADDLRTSYGNSLFGSRRKGTPFGDGAAKLLEGAMGGPS